MVPFNLRPLDKPVPRELGQQVRAGDAAAAGRDQR